MRRIIRRLGRLSRRQLASLLVVAGLAGVTVAAAILDRLALATMSVGVLGLTVFVSTLQLRRRLASEMDAVKLEVRQGRHAIVREVRSLSTHRALAAEHLEAAHRRVLATLESERLSAADRQRELLTRMDRSVRELTGLHRDAARDAARREQEQTRDLESALQLYRHLRPRAPMPPSGGWALAATGLLEVLFLIERQRPKLVLELGSGTSTVWIGYALERCGGYLISVDHAADFAERTRSALLLHGLEGVADVRIAPLRTVQVGEEEYQWYEEDAFTGLSEVDLLIVDGPPGATGPQARYPALPMLRARLAADATVLLDDANRPDEGKIVKRWLQEHPGLAQERAVSARQAVLSYARH